MNISDLKFKYGLFLAPLAGVTDKTFRTICRNFGAELVFSEMSSAKAMYYGDKKTFKLTETGPDERPIAIQIFGNEPEIMAFAAKRLSLRDDVCIIDINMGCPAAKIVKNNEGAALFNNIELSEKIIRSVVKASYVPVTVKTRIGWNDDSSLLEFVNMVENTGVSAITVHGRTKQQMYSGKANWDAIKKVKENVKIPVIGNGDIFCGEDAKRFKEHSGVDGIMVGRGVLGNPWIFKEILSVFKGTTNKKPSSDEIMKVMIKHLNDLEKDIGEYRAIHQMRKHISWYTKGMDNCNEFKRRAFEIIEKRVLVHEIEHFFKKGQE